MPDLHQGLAEYFRYVTYSITGASYKSEALRRFIDHYLPGRGGLSTLDLGGGIGLVDLELLLTSPGIAKATVCDPVAYTLPLTKRIFDAYRSFLAGRYRQAISAAQELGGTWDADRPADRST